MASAHDRDRQMTNISNKNCPLSHNLILEIAVFNCFNSGDHLIREEIPKDTDEDEESTCADQDEDIDELDPFSDFED